MARYNPHAPRPKTRGQRPGAWVSGPDPVEHYKYRVWMQQRNQAQWREEGWSISFEEWKKLWDESGHWEDRGRVKGTWCMTRRDWSLPWTLDNVAIVTREEHVRLQGQFRSLGWRSLAQKKYRQRQGLPAQPRRPGRKKQ